MRRCESRLILPNEDRWWCAGTKARSLREKDVLAMIAHVPKSRPEVKVLGWAGANVVAALLGVVLLGVVRAENIVRRRVSGVCITAQSNSTRRMI